MCLVLSDLQMYKRSPCTLVLLDSTQCFQFAGRKKLLEKWTISLQQDFFRKFNKRRVETKEHF